MGIQESIAIFGNIVATDLVRVSTDPADLDEGGWWVVAANFEGEFLAFEFGTVTTTSSLHSLVNTYAGNFDGVVASAWRSSMDQAMYEAGVRTIHEEIAKGWVYQVNLCRVLTAELDASMEFDPVGLYMNLAQHNPAPYSGVIRVFSKDSGLSEDVFVVSASPELFIQRNGQKLLSRPIKGTSATVDGFLEKDTSENVMIVDLVRNDLSNVCAPGTVNVPVLLAAEEHPGLFHLVSDIEGQLEEGTSWVQILESLSPAGSVSGAPKMSALEVINRLEPSKRSIYCGGFGWVNSDEDSACLAVGIRTFWFDPSARTLNFGTGAGITWHSDPHQEWLETELKARHLLNVASQRYAGHSESSSTGAAHHDRQQEN